MNRRCDCCVFYGMIMVVTEMKHELIYYEFSDRIFHNGQLFGKINKNQQKIRVQSNLQQSRINNIAWNQRILFQFSMWFLLMLQKKNEFHCVVQIAFQWLYAINSKPYFIYSVGVERKKSGTDVDNHQPEKIKCRSARIKINSPEYASNWNMIMILELFAFLQHI